VQDAGRLDPMECRRSALRFSPNQVAARYERAYETAMAEAGVRQAR
jgi:hypothetical protein